MTLGEHASQAKESATCAAERSEANKSVTAVSLTMTRLKEFSSGEALCHPEIFNPANRGT